MTVHYANHPALLNAGKILQKDKVILVWFWHLRDESLSCLHCDTLDNVSFPEVDPISLPFLLVATGLKLIGIYWAPVCNFPSSFLELVAKVGRALKFGSLACVFDRLRSRLFRFYSVCGLPQSDFSFLLQSILKLLLDCVAVGQRGKRHRAMCFLWHTHYLSDFGSLELRKPITVLATLLSSSLNDILRLEFARVIKNVLC